MAGLPQECHPQLEMHQISGRVGRRVSCPLRTSGDPCRRAGIFYRSPVGASVHPRRCEVSSGNTSLPARHLSSRIYKGCPRSRNFRNLSSHPSNNQSTVSHFLLHSQANNCFFNQPLTTTITTFTSSRPLTNQLSQETDFAIVFPTHLFTNLLDNIFQVKNIL